MVELPLPGVVGGGDRDMADEPVVVVDEVEEVEEAAEGSIQPRPSTEEEDEPGMEPDADPGSWTS
jgi:hypothetical protein